MDAKEYHQKALLTDTKDFEPVKLRVQDPILAAKILKAIEASIVAGEAADKAKRAVFYGKIDVSSVEEAAAILSSHGERARIDMAMKSIVGQGDVGNLRLLHALLGVVSEASELSEALLKKRMPGETLDTTNVIEEIGDVLWYLTIALDSVGSNLEDAMERNAKKLEKRYKKQGFSEDSAIHRDLQAEREILEGKSQ